MKLLEENYQLNSPKINFLERKVKIENKKRGEIEKVINTNNNDFFIVSF